MEIYVGNDDGHVYALKGPEPEILAADVFNDIQAAQSEDDKDTVETQDGYIIIDGIKMPVNMKNGHVLRVSLPGL